MNFLENFLSYLEDKFIKFSDYIQMKTLSQIINETLQINAQEDAIGILSKARLEKYLETANKFISDETKQICKWLIENESWMKTAAKSDKNPLQSFFNAGAPKDKSMAPLYKNIAKLYKADRLIEIPLFMTKEQIDGILSKKLSPDEVFLDFESDKGRNEIAKKYTPLVHKIARSWVGKTAFTYDELVSYAYQGLIWAMDSYGKKTNKQKKREEMGGEEIDMTKYKGYTFLSFASQMMRNAILDAAKNDSRIVRIPVSQQNKLRSEQGFIAKSNTISGDQPMGTNKDGEGQSLFDIVGGIENPGIKIDREELDKLWDQVCKKLEQKFGEKTMDIFYNYFGFGGKKQLKGKEMAKKYGYKSPASITAEVVKVVNFIKKDPKMLARFTDIYELMKEHQEDLDELDSENDLYYIADIDNKIMESKDEKDDIMEQ